jgi:hypothetical protein
MTMSTQDDSNSSANPLQGRLEAFADHMETQISINGHDTFTPDQWAKIRKVLQSSHELLVEMK